MGIGTVLRRLPWILLGLLAAIQLLPYGRARTNPPVAAEPAWDRPRTRELFFRACADCHSNETRWPWYSQVAPASWLVQRDVDEAREHFNVSEWGRPRNEGEEAAEELEEGAMPLPRYLRAHPAARLSDAEKQDLVRGLAATFPHEPGEGREKRRGADAR
jgi:mono/diheme cytochrome c family protein